MLKNALHPKLSQFIQLVGIVLTLGMVFLAGLSLYSSHVYIARPIQRIMAVGDSITEGVQGQVSYRQELERLLTRSGCSFEMVGSEFGSQDIVPSTFVSRHEGYSGHRADHINLGNTKSKKNRNEGIVAMMGFSPDVVLLHVGTNDITRNEPVNTIVNDIEDIVENIRNINPDTLVFVANVIPRFVNGVVDPTTDALSDAIEASFNSPDTSKDDDDLGGFNNVFIVDVRSGYVRDNSLADGRHPNNSGESKIANAFFNALELANACDANRSR